MAKTKKTTKKHEEVDVKVEEPVKKDVVVASKVEVKQPVRRKNNR